MTTSVSPRPEPTADGSGLTRHVTVTPHMCGGSAAIFAQLGDWTWETVAAASGTNVYDARTSDGRPAYLSFYYFQVRGSAAMHPHGLSFGDELTVTSRAFDFGSESVLTLHRLSRTHVAEPLTPAEFFDAPRPDCLYAQNFNRWISRGSDGGNEALVRSSPEGFCHTHLPVLPTQYSPRGRCVRARKETTFHPGGPAGYALVQQPSTLDYSLDVVRDFNGVGLVYFAAYFSIIDTALLWLWRRLGRSDWQFLSRRVLDHQVGYFGNANVDSTLNLTVRLWRRDSASGDEIAEVVVRNRESGRLLAVSAIRLLVEES